MAQLISSDKLFSPDPNVWHIATLVWTSSSTAVLQFVFGGKPNKKEDDS